MRPEPSYGAVGDRSCRHCGNSRCRFATLVRACGIATVETFAAGEGAACA